MLRSFNLFHFCNLFLLMEFLVTFYLYFALTHCKRFFLGYLKVVRDQCLDKKIENGNGINKFYKSACQKTQKGTYC